MQSCIAQGATKINVNRLVLDEYYSYIRHSHSGTVPHTVLIEESTSRVISLTMRWMQICGSAGKAF